MLRQGPIYIPAAGDPDSTSEEASRTILATERRFPQFVARLENVRRAWAALPRATPAAQKPPSIAALPLPSATSGSAGVLRTKSGQVFQSWTATDIDGDSVVISHADGITRISISDLPDDLSGFSPDMITRVQQIRRQAAVAKQTKAQKEGIASALVKSTPQLSPAPGASPPWKTVQQRVADALADMRDHTQHGDEIRTRLEQESSGKLVVKGLFLGMNFDDCYAAFQPFGKDSLLIEKRDALEEKSLSAVLYGRTENEMIYGIMTKGGFRIGSILVDPDTNKVIGFDFSEYLSDILFNSDDLSVSDFAQQFINNYNIPTLTPGVRNGEQGLIYDSPDGWTLRISPYKGVHLEVTKAHTFGN